MLEYRRTGGAVVLEAAPGRVAARWWLLLARVITAGRIAPGGVPGGRADAGLGKAGGIAVAAAAPLAYLLPLAASTGAGVAAQASTWPVTAGLLAAIAVGVVAYCVNLRCRAYLLSHRVVLWHEVSASLLDAAERYAQRTVQGWPDVAPLVDCPDPRPLVEQALWGLGQQLAALEGSRNRLVAAERALRLVPTDGRVRRELTHEQCDAEVLWRHRERQVARRLAVLRRLAEACDESRRCRAADSLAASDPAADPLVSCDPTAEDIEALVGRAEAVVGAYRDLLR